nr:hypothetical protein [Evansella caseinilytica]
MNLTWFLITIAPPLIVFACILFVFLWATYGKPLSLPSQESSFEEKQQSTPKRAEQISQQISS